jgi:sigma-B regulation protein RsbU (phosphoserine phosphatase)
MSLAGNFGTLIRSRAAQLDAEPVRTIERAFSPALAILVFASLALVWYADYMVHTVSLGFLYVLPLALSAFVFDLRVSLPLALASVVFADLFGPFGHTGGEHIARNAFTAVGFMFVVIVVDRLVAQQTRLSDVVRVQRDELQRDIELAADVQQRLLPLSPPAVSGFDFSGKMVPARLVGGDYFDYIELPGNDLGLVIADVSGDGPAAALLMSSVEVALRVDAPSNSQTNSIISNLNKVLCDVTAAERYVTMFYAKLDVSRRVLQYTTAGHLPPLLLRRGNDTPEQLETLGMPVGIFVDATFGSAEVNLEQGDILVLYTDGITEARNADDEQFGVERLGAVVRENRESSADLLVNAIDMSVDDFRSHTTPEDDQTVIVVKVTSGAPERHS